MKTPASTAQRLALRCQGLDGQWELPEGKEGVAQAIEQLGYVQIDTIAVVQRAHHHTLWSRRADYTSQMLHELQAQDRRVFEWWTHAASYIPMCDYRYYLPRMRAFAERRRTRKWLEQHEQLVKDVMERIRTEGPLGSADFKAPEGFKRGTWWSWKPAKEALETLFSMGELMVAERRNFQRMYDLTEQVLPPETDTSEPDRDEWGRFAVRRILASLGLASISDVQWGRRWGKKAIAEALEDLVGSGEVTPLEIEGLDGQAYYALTEAIEGATEHPRREATLHILSPFDNLVIRRKWLKDLFDFEYRLECYLPAPQRRYGYFSLPILWGERFVGRVDSKADRKPKTLIVRQVTFEPDVTDYGGLLPALAEKLRAFAAFNACERIVVEQTEPGEVKAGLERELGVSEYTVVTL